MPGKALIIGCGYIGLPLALELQRRGHYVTAWTHTEYSANALKSHHFERTVAGSVADDRAWSGAGDTYDLVFHCASSKGGGERAYEEIYHQGAIRMAERLSRARKIFISSTSVYGQTEGEIVTEESTAEPTSATGKILRQAEEVMLGAAATVVRSSGIYGPDRSTIFDKFRRGEAEIEGDVQRWINKIHQRDLVAALLHLSEAGQPAKIYNACDDMPVMQRDYYAWCAEFMRMPMPPHGLVNPQRKRGLTNKRVSNSKLRETGWTPIYPSFREGLTADYSPR